MLTGLHILLSYRCNLNCSHCFLYCSPLARGTFPQSELRDILEQANEIDTLEWIFFEGGEPLLYPDLLKEGIRLAVDRGYQVGVVSNACSVGSKEEALAMLRPLAELGIAELSLSEDAFHFGKSSDTPASYALSAARELDSCPHEDLIKPERVHVDAYGNVQVCQGLSLGNWKANRLEKILRQNLRKHPLCGPLSRGGPAALAEELALAHESDFVDECHFCFLLRRSLVQRFPEEVAPRQVYGLD
ncbi:MAG: radical SAM protein [Candidatus Krumholzibacteria bacterium]|jgi:hypothetical protein|nr:radical SAM protein [Candidatus Krumholzibacteria bacterium]MDP6796390.1 radical SAM protein [Candidatus Krumholzibacteria bacterium]MDP7022025.1 radical SAM protein [Candidatus Krumholzibacteria bacterium]